MDIFEKLKNVKTMPELDSLRLETVREMSARGQKGFREVRNAFIAAKNRLVRIPLKDRCW